MPAVEFTTYRWSVRHYDRLTRTLGFRNRRVELLQGRIIETPPQREPHAAGILLASPLLASAFGSGYFVRTQMPIELGRYSKPEPDLAVVVGNPRDYVKTGPPTTALLIVEVADATLAYDRGRKASVYARFGIADYWILNVIDRQLEVHRRPMGDPAHRYRFRYADISILKEGDAVSPLAAAGSTITIADMLP